MLPQPVLTSRRPNVPAAWMGLDRPSSFPIRTSEPVCLSRDRLGSTGRRAWKRAGGAVPRPTSEDQACG